MVISSNPNIILRTCAGTRQGIGHVSRCLVLAKIIRSYCSTEPIFIVKTESAPICARISHTGYPIHTLPLACSEIDELVWIKKHYPKPSLFILDDYQLSPSYVLRLRQFGHITLHINDIPEEILPTHAILNHTPGLSFTLYPEQILYSGPSYTLIAPHYRQPFRETERTGVVIAFGGADPENITERVLQHLITLNCPKPIYVITGHLYQYDLSTYTKITWLKDLDTQSLYNLWQHSDVALLPASTMCLEAMSVGIPVITGYYANNQQKLAHSLAELGCAHSLGDWHNVTAQQVGSALQRINVNTMLAAQTRTFHTSPPPEEALQNMLLELKSLI